MKDAIMRSSFGAALRALDGWIDGPATLINERWHAMRPGDRVVARIAEDGRSVTLSSDGKGTTSQSLVPLEPQQEAQARAALGTMLAERDVTIVVPQPWVIERRVDHLQRLVGETASATGRSSDGNRRRAHAFPTPPASTPPN